MTREEAIRHLEYLKVSYPLADISEWIDMAIEALQTDVVRCKDCTNFDHAFNYCDFLEAGVEGEDFFCAYGERKGGGSK